MKKRVRWCAVAMLASGLTACSGRRPSELTLTNDDQALTILDVLVGQYESFGAPKADVVACRHKFTAVRDELKADHYDVAGERLHEALDCTRAIGDAVSTQLDALRDNHHLELDLKELLGRDVDFGQGLYKLVGIKFTPQGSSVRYDLEFRSIPGNVGFTKSFLLR